MKLKHLILASLAIASEANVNAQGITNGETYYIQNVESGLFLGGANSWGTQGTVSTQGEQFKATLSNGQYTLTNMVVTASNKTFGYNLFVDTNTGENGNLWTIAEVDGKPGVYTIYGKGKANKVANAFDGFLSQSATAGNHIGFMAGSVNPADASAEWRFLTKEEAINQLKTVSWGNSMSASFLLENPNFSRNHSVANWKVSSNCTNKNLAGGDNGNMCAESYHSPFTISQTLTGIPNGVYGVTAQGFVRSDGGNVADVMFFANEATQAFPVKTGTENSMTDASNSFKTGAYTIEEFKVTVTNGTLEVGVKNTSKDLWCIWDNFNLTYYGVDVTALQEALAGRITVAQGISGDMNAEVASALANAITTAQTASPTEESLNAALSAINTAITNAEASIAIYTAIAEKYNTLDAAGKAAFETTTNGAKYIAKTLVNEDCAADLATAAKAQTTEGADMTLAIVNPTVDGITGWTAERPKGGNGPLLGGTAFEYWGGNASSRDDASFDYYQVIENLPAGVYEVSAEMSNSLNGEAGATFNESCGVYGNNSIAYVTTEGDARNKYTATVTVTNGTLRLGVKSDKRMGARWFTADNFTLTFVSAISLDDYRNNVASLLTQANAITGKQQASLATALATAISATEGYESETDTETLNGMIDGLTDAIANSNASVAAYAALNSALNDIYVDRSAAFGTEFTYRTEAQAMYDEATAATADVNAKANGMMNAYRTYVKGIADSYPTVDWIKDARNAEAWVFTTEATNKGNYNNPGNNDINGDTMRENWKSGGLVEGEMKQTVSVPDGKYFLRMCSFTRNTPNAEDYIYIKSGETTETSISFGDPVKPNAFVNITNPIEVTNGQVEIGLHVGSGADWAAIGGVVLYAMAEDVNRTTATDKFGTICLPYAATATGATVYSAEVIGDYVALTEVEGNMVAGTPYIYQATAGAQTFAYASGNVVAAPVAAAPLTGVFTATEVPVGAYVMQTHDGVQAFHQVAADAQPTLSANKAYLTVETPSAARIAIGATTTAINAVNALINGNAKIHDLNGHQLRQLQKGVNIVNGTKVVVK